MATRDGRFAPEWLVGAGMPHRGDDRIAVTDGPVVLTYRELGERASRMAAALRARGVLPGDRVVLVLENSWQYVASYFAVLMAGGVVVPLHYGARERDLLTWIHRVEASAAIVDAEHASFAALGAALAGRRVTVSELLAPVHSPGADEIFRPSADSPAVVTFTSGTTGAPKGILLTHGNLRCNATDIVESLSLTATDRVMTALPFTYAYGSSVLLSHLACGAHVVIQRNFVFPEAVLEAMAHQRVTGFAGVPSSFSLLLRGDFSRHDLSALRYVTQAGGAMPTSQTRRLIEALPGKQIYVMYGQTEATARLTCLPPDRLTAKLGSVGLPLRHVEIQIRDASGLEKPAGATGDVWVRGANVMSGYWRDAESTDQVLRDGWLRTGDVGYRDDEGFLYIVGRRSDIIKVGAHRVAPQDVEAVIVELPGVDECAVIGVDDEILGQVIKAFVVSPPGSEIAEIQVKRHCRENLPAYKVPKYVEFVAGLPRTASGKVQRSKLLESQESVA